MGHPRFLFCLFVFWQTQILQETPVGFSRIRTWIIRVEDEHADHLTTATAKYRNISLVPMSLV